MQNIAPEDREKMLASRMTKEEYERHQKEQHRRDHPEDYEKQETYLEDEFRQYVSEKYPH